MTIKYVTATSQLSTVCLVREATAYHEQWAPEVQRQNQGWCQHGCQKKKKEKKKKKRTDGNPLILFLIIHLP